MEERKVKWEKEKWTRERGSECAPAASAAVVGHARCRSRARGQGASAAGCAGQEAKARAAGAKCGRRSRVGDRRPCDAGWDGGEEKEKRVRSAGKKNGTTIGTGRRKKKSRRENRV